MADGWGGASGEAIPKSVEYHALANGIRDSIRASDRLGTVIVRLTRSEAVMAMNIIRDLAEKEQTHEQDHG